MCILADPRKHDNFYFLEISRVFVAYTEALLLQGQLDEADLAYLNFSSLQKVNLSDDEFLLVQGHLLLKFPVLLQG